MQGQSADLFAILLARKDGGGGGGGGTGDYNDLSHQPQINNNTLVGNKTSSALGLQDKLVVGTNLDSTPTDSSSNPVTSGGVYTAISDMATKTWVGQQGFLTSADEVPEVTSDDDGKVLKASYSGGVGTYSWQTGGGSGGTSDYTDLENKPQINSNTLSGNKTSAQLGLVAGLASGTTQNNLVKWGSDGYTVADAGIAVETSLTANSDTKIPTSKAVASHVTTEIGKLDVAGASNIAASKTISAWSEADGKVSLTTQNIAIAKSQITDFPTLGTAAAADTTDFATAAQGSTADTAIQSFKINSGSELKSGTSVNVTSVPASILTGAIPSDVTATTQDTSTKNTSVATTAFVHDVVDALPEPMVFKGTLGTGGTITTLPVDGTATVGDTYKVITDGTYASQPAKIGDTFICQTKTSNANTWVLIPSGDEPSGTVTSVGVARDSSNHAKGIKTDQTNDGPITTSGTLSLALQSDTYSSLTATTRGSVADREYAVGLDASGNLSVNVPWTTPVTSVAGKTGAVTLQASDVGLGNVTNDAQVKKISSSVSGDIVTWSATTGDTVADSGKSFETSLTANSDTKIPTSKAVADYIANQYPRLYVDNQGYIAIDYGS